jgi:hypothetical protein
MNIGEDTRKKTRNKERNKDEAMFQEILCCTIIIIIKWQILVLTEDNQKIINLKLKIQIISIK